MQFSAKLQIGVTKYEYEYEYMKVFQSPNAIPVGLDKYSSMLHMDCCV